MLPGDGVREDLTDNLGLSPEDTEKIRSGNALSLISRNSALVTP